ncbi:biogenesis of lysosome-related organelles complex 1 subunit 3 [Dromaius novaehollandiae]|uniref:biogenesis of lysosome-related organelles complex 1 subunit 3 n=1 Tax=Dromaius novaehollandiae TaxID=8790 RepID=UPI00311F2B61
MAAPRARAVVPGEASESDSDSELGPAPASTAPAGIKVPGEASETDSEEEEEEEGGARPKGALPAPALPPLRVERSPAAVPVPVPAAVPVPWGGSLLQQRLLEGNARLRGAVGGAVGQGYAAAARHLGALAAPLRRAQAAATGASHSLRLARRDLRAVAAAVDIVAGCGLLPDIRGDLPPV